MPGECFHHLRQPEDDAVGAAQQAEPHERGEPYQRLPQHAPIIADPAAQLRGRLMLQKFSILGGEPAGLLRMIGKIAAGGQAQEQCRQRLGNQQPPPRGQLRGADHGHQPTGQRAAQCHRQGNGDHGDAEGAGAVRLGGELAQVQHDAGGQAAFGQAQQDAQGIKLQR